MAQPQHPLINVLKAKQNAMNRECQKFQRQIKAITDEMVHSNAGREDLSRRRAQINRLCNDYSATINQLEIRSFVECERSIRGVAGSVGVSLRSGPVIKMQSASTSKGGVAHKQWRCEPCGLSYTAQSSLRRHNRKNHGARSADIDSDSECATNSDADYLSDADSSDGGRTPSIYSTVKQRAAPRPACFCGADFANKKYLHQHLLNVHKVNPYECGEADCSERFRTKKDLDRHRSAAHSVTASRPFSCSKCGATFPSKYAGHMSAAHRASRSCSGSVAVAAAAATAHRGRKLQGTAEAEVAPKCKASVDEMEENLFGRTMAQHAAAKLYCVCKGPDDGRPMLQCDHCREWYHLECVAVTDHEAEANRGFKFKCPVCNGDGATASFNSPQSELSEGTGGVEEGPRKTEGDEDHDDDDDDDDVAATAASSESAASAASATSSESAESAVAGIAGDDAAVCCCGDRAEGEGIGCSDCSVFYHFSCVGLLEETARNLSDYKCPQCRTRSEHSGAESTAMPRLEAMAVAQSDAPPTPSNDRL